MLDEPSLRRPTFREGRRFKLADGQEWSFPEPNLETFPRFRDGQVELGLATDFGPEFDALVESAQRAEDFAGQLAIVFALAAIMLRRNYALADADLSSLLRHRVGDEASFAMYSDIADVALGNAPKRPPVGSA